MKLRFTPRATHDLTEIAQYVRERNPAAALRVREGILRSLQNLAQFPELGRKQEEEGVRKLVTRRYPYLVYYTVNHSTDEIIILAIRHSSRQSEHSDA